MKKILILSILSVQFLLFGCAHHGVVHESSAVQATDVHSKVLAVKNGNDVLQDLREGNKRFIQGELLHPNIDQARKSEMAKGQAPGAVVVSCSDSRTAAELIFDQGLGDIFAVRSAGHALEATDIASIEYSVEHLGSTLILVMGHTSCGAVKATLSTPVGKSAGSKSLDALVSHLRPMVGSASANDPKYIIPVKRNVDATINQILKASPMIKKKVQNHELTLARGIYDLDIGEVTFWSER